MYTKNPIPIQLALNWVLLVLFGFVIMTSNVVGQQVSNNNLPSNTGGKIIEADFKPHPLLKNRHLQTIWPSLTHRKNPEIFRRQRLELPDGDFLDLDWFVKNPDSNSLSVLIHGLSGSSNSNYIKRVGNQLLASGVQVVALNLRGATGPNRLKRSYHSGETSDIDYVIRYLKRAHAIEPPNLYAVGFSLGGNALLKWLGENPNQSLVSKAVAVSPPMDLAIASKTLDRGFAKAYRNAIMKGLKSFAKSKQAIVEDDVDMEAVLECKTFFQYDDQFTAPLNGFNGAEDYYRQSSSRQFLKYINTETLIIHARDDPFVTPEIIPEQSELGAGVTLELSRKGGHLGFVAKGKGLATQFWLGNRISRFLVAEQVSKE